tara:strand:- start:2628 stop:2918 length:291 start_codon:yes stop_codon:yes gene_type:complete
MEKDVKIEDIAKDVKKISEEELKLIQGKVQILNNLQMQVGGIEIQKTAAIDQLKAAQADMQKTQNELEEKYGKVSVNLTDGTIKEIPEEDEANKED